LSKQPSRLHKTQAYTENTARVHNNILAQLELLGMPLSAGDLPGEGVRLVLGSDVMPVRGKVNNQVLGFDIPTRWLLPASVAAFDPRCNKADMDAALADGCTLLGVHAASCTTGCGADPQQEARWAALTLEGSVEYPVNQWQVR
jgi:hypothetical protein